MIRWSKMVALTILLVSGSYAHALCIYKGSLYAKTSLDEEFLDSGLVIKGRVISSEDIKINNTDEDVGVVSRVRVEDIFKGRADKIIVFYSRRDSGGFYLDRGTGYLLFLDPIRTTEWAQDYPMAMVVNYNCGQSRPWVDVSASNRDHLWLLRKRSQ